MRVDASIAEAYHAFVGHGLSRALPARIGAETDESPRQGGSMARRRIEAGAEDRHRVEPQQPRQDAVAFTVEGEQALAVRPETLTESRRQHAPDGIGSAHRDVERIGASVEEGSGVDDHSFASDSSTSLLIGT